MDRLAPTIESFCCSINGNEVSTGTTVVVDPINLKTHFHKIIDTQYYTQKGNNSYLEVGVGIKLTDSLTDVGAFVIVLTTDSQWQLLMKTKASSRATGVFISLNARYHPLASRITTI